MVARARATSLIVLRTLFGLAFVGSVAALGLFLFGREGRPAEPPEPETTDALETADLALRGEGFHFALTDGGDKIFEIRGDEQRSDRSGMMALENVTVSIWRDNGVYSVLAEKAFYREDSQDARLQGAVKLRGPDGLWIEARRLELSEEGQNLIAREGARFGAQDQVEGQADLLEAAFGSSEFTLTGNVLLRGDPSLETPFELRANELFFDQQRGFGRANEGVWIRSGRNTIEGERLHLNLDARTNEITFLRLLWGVAGRLAPDLDDPTSVPIDVEATSLTMNFDRETGEATGLELRGLAQRPARVEQRDEDETLLAIETVSLEGSFRLGVISHALLEGSVLLSERPGGDDSLERRVAAASGEVRFSDQGRVTGVTLDGGIEISDRDIAAVGERTALDLEAGEVHLFGDPVKALHPRGTLEAGRIRYLEDMTLVHGSDGIAAVLESGEGGGGLSVAGARGPIRVTADETFWLSEPDSVLFQGKVRAWQGSYALLASELRGEETSGRMSAGGGVRTLWNPPESDEPPPSPPPPVADEGDAGSQGEEYTTPVVPRGSMEISAQEMVYRSAEGEVSYEGNVRAQQERSSIRCDTLSVLLGEGSEAESLDCAGNVHIEDSASGLLLQGTQALYDLDREQLDLIGEPIAIRDAQGNGAEKVRALTYSFEDEILVLRSMRDAPAQLRDNASPAEVAAPAPPVAPAPVAAPPTAAPSDSRSP